MSGNRIVNNDGDGIGIMPGSKAWIAGNNLKDNDGSGMRINIDGSEIWTKNNTYRENKREGIEINSFGKFKLANPYIIRQDLIEELGGTENPDLSEVVDKEVTEELERLYKDGSDEAAIQAGKLIAKQIIENTQDDTGLIAEVQV